MAGGLLQLVASGNQDLILTYKPEFTFFKKIYHRHTNFSKFYKEIKFKNKISFGRENNIIIPKHGDLLDNIYIKINIPSLKCSYSLNKYEEYAKRINKLSLKIIDDYDYKLINRVFNNIKSVINNDKKFYFIKTNDTTSKIILNYQNCFYYINNLLDINKTFYIRSSEIFKTILDNEINEKSKIFFNFNYNDNITYNNTLNIPELDINSSKIIYNLYCNNLFCNNYHTYFNYLYHKNITSSPIKLKSSNIYLSDLYEFYKNSITLDLNNKTINFLDTLHFSRGDNIDISLNSDVSSDKYIIKITKQNILEENITIILNYTSDQYSNSTINNILKKVKVKTTNEQDQIYNYNFYYESLSSNLRNDLGTLSLLPSKTGITIDLYNISNTILNTDDLVFTLDKVDNLEKNQIIFAFLNTNTSKIIPDAFYKINSIDSANKKLTCEVPKLSILDKSNVKLFDGINKLNVGSIQNISSDVYTNYLFMEGLESNLLSSYSSSEYMSYIRVINKEIVNIELQLIKNLINSLFKNSNYISRYYNVDQNSLIVDGSSLKSIIDLTTFNTFKNNFISYNESTFINSDVNKYKLFNRINNLFTIFYTNESKLWDTYVTGSFSNRDYNILKTRLQQISYLNGTVPYISITYDTINLSDGTTASTVGDIYEVYPDDGTGQPNTNIDALAELTTINKTTITSPSTITTLTLQLSTVLDYSNIVIGNFLVKKNTTIYAKITNIYNSYFEISNITGTVSNYRGFFYTNIFYNFYLQKIYHEISSNISLFSVNYSGRYLLNKADNTQTTTIPTIGDSYFLYNNISQSITTKLDIVNVIFDGTFATSADTNSTITLQTTLLGSFTVTLGTDHYNNIESGDYVKISGSGSNKYLGYHLVNNVSGQVITVSNANSTIFTSLGNPADIIGNSSVEVIINQIEVDSQSIAVTSSNTANNEIILSNSSSGEILVTYGTSITNNDNENELLQISGSGSGTYLGSYLIKSTNGQTTTLEANAVIFDGTVNTINGDGTTIIEVKKINITSKVPSTKLDLKINTLNAHNFEIRKNFWLINSEEVTSSQGIKITSYNTNNLNNLNLKTLYISSKIHAVTNQDAYSNSLETLQKEATLSYYVDYSQLFNSASIINELFENYNNFLTIPKLKTYLDNKIINTVTYSKTGNLSTMTNAEVINLTKQYFLTTYLNLEEENEFSIVRGMDNHINNYFNIIDSILINEEEIGILYYQYVNDTNAVSKNLVKSKIEENVLRKSETRELNDTELNTYLNLVTTLETSYNNNYNTYNNNKTLLKINNFDIKTDIFKDPNDTKNDITQLINDNNLLVSTVDLTLYNNGLNEIFSAANINNSLYSILNSINTNNSYNKFMYLENLLTSFLQNKIYLKDVSNIKLSNELINSSSLNDANEFLKEKGIDEFIYFNSNGSNIYIPNKKSDNISNKFNYINNLSNADKLIEKGIYDLEPTVRQSILTYYTTNINNNFLNVESLESYLTTNITGYKFKYGTLLTDQEYLNQNYIVVKCYVDKVNTYGAISSLYIVNLNNVLVNSLIFPFKLQNIWLSDEISQVKISYSASGYILTLKSDCLPHPLNPGKFPNSNSKNSILPQNFERKIRLRVGENDNTPTNITTKEIGILSNGILLYTIFGINDIPNLNNDGFDSAPTGFNWNPIKYLNRFGSDYLGGNPDNNGIYHFYNSEFFKNWSHVGNKNLYYYSTNSDGDIFRHKNGHSKIIGLMLDGYPLYGPYGFTDPNDDTSVSILMQTSYSLKTTLDAGRPSENDYAKGSFVQDYEFINGSGSLDQFNGRFCKTPEYPNGTYAYFITVDNSNNPKFPYIIGNQFKSTPSTSSTYNPTDGTGTNINILPSATVNTNGFSNNESIFFGGGSGYQGKGTISVENNSIKINILQSGYKYKKGDIVFLRKENIDSTLEYSDKKRIIIKRKSRFSDGFYYDFIENKLKIISINESDTIQMNNFLKELKNLIVNGNITNATVNTAIATQVFNIIPINLIIQQLMTISPQNNSFINDLQKIDIKQNINTLLEDQFFLDIFNEYIKKYKSDKFSYYYNEDISYVKYFGSEYNMLNLDIDYYLKYLTNENISDMKDIVSNKINKLDENSINMENNINILENILTREESPKFAWISKLGNYLFEKVSIYFNELLIDKQHDDWINIWNEINVNENKKEGLDRLIGNLKELYTMDNKIKPKKTLYIPLRFWFCNIPGMNIPLIAMPYVDVKVSMNIADINNLVRKDVGVKIESNTNLDAVMLVNYIYLDENERKLFAESRHEYLIEQVQSNFVTDIFSSTSIITANLSFKNCVKDIFYAFKKKSDIYLRDICNYSMTDNDYLNGENPVEKTTFEFNGRERFRNYSGEYTNYIIPYEKYISTPADGINVLSFNLNNDNFQPSGSCNFSFIENPYLKISLKDNFLSNNEEGKLLIFSRSYNILRIMSGLSGLAFMD